MDDKPHYSEEDVSAIFQQAIKSQDEARKKLGKRDGLTLEELQEIGADLGITPEFIAKAAASRRTQLSARPDKTLLGIPVSVERVMELPRQLGADEWGRLVGDLRDTFQARGSVSDAGSLRQWSNGNLSATVEPHGNGAYRLRLRTEKGTAASSLGSSLMVAVFGVLLTTMLLLKNLPQDPSKYAFAAFFILAGFVVASFTAMTVPRWHRERSEQFDAIAGRISVMMTEPQGDASLAEVTAARTKTHAAASRKSAAAALDAREESEERIDVESGDVYSASNEADRSEKRERG